MAVQSFSYSVYVLLIILTTVSKIIALKVAVISNCNQIIDTLYLIRELNKLGAYDIAESIEPSDLNQLSSNEDDICEKGTEYSVVYKAIMDPEYDVVVATIDNEFCELTRILTLLYKKYVISWDCKSLLVTDYEYSNYFIRLTKNYRNGIILLSELLFQMKWRSVVLFVIKNNSVISDSSTALTFIHGIKRFFYESHIEIRGSYILSQNSNLIFQNFSKLLSSNIKCAVIIGTDLQTPTALHHIKRIHSFMRNETAFGKVVQIYLSLDRISKQMFQLIEEAANESMALKLVVIPSLNMSDKQNLKSNLAHISVTHESNSFTNEDLYPEIARTLISIKCQTNATKECENFSDTFERKTSQTVSGHKVQEKRYGQASFHYSIYCINCTQIRAITKLSVNYNSYEIDIDNLINLPEPDIECLFDDSDCHHFAINGMKSVNRFIAERISVFSKEILVLVLCLSSMMAFIFVRFNFRRNKDEQRLLRLIILSSSDMEFNDFRRNASSNSSTPSSVTSISKNTLNAKFTAKLRGEIVNIKPIIHRSASNSMSTSVKQDVRPQAFRHLLRLYRLKHENLTKFMALIQNCIQIDFSYVFVWEYCSRGTLAEVITKTEIKLDWNFKISLIGDIIRGMTYLHDSSVQTHGYLNSSNCVIDSRWLLKITNFGLNKFREIQTLNSTECYELNDLLWFAPELLRLSQPFWYSSQKADVYSFAIILQEVLLRDKPYSSYKHLSVMDIIERVKYSSPSFRPELIPNDIKSHSEELIPKNIIKLTRCCWSEDPDDRPTFNRLADEFKKYLGEREMSLVDQMLLKIEKYSNCLEELVEERTIKLEEERKRSEELLYRMLPMSVAENLKNGIEVQPEKFSDVTIFFSDIIGFTTIAAYSEPLEVITILNDLYSAFDEIIQEFNVYKVETIGDAYMVVSGLPQRNDDHAEQIASMALEILHFCVKFKMRHMPTIPLQLRCGVHSGSVVGGVVGNTNPRYCLFGDAVNIASRLESTSRSYRIHISKSTEEKLRQTGEYVIQYRGEITLKGRGKQPTYYLLGKVGFDKVLPEPMHNEEGENHGIQDEDIFTSLGLTKQLF